MRIHYHELGGAYLLGRCAFHGLDVIGVSPCDDDGPAGAVVMVLRRLRGLHESIVGYSELIRVIQRHCTSSQALES